MDVLYSNIDLLEYDESEFEEISLKGVLESLVKYPEMIEHNYIKKCLKLIIEQMKQ
jgi:hypothetical protein